MADQWLSIVEYARQFNMSDMTVRRRIKTGKINAVLRDGKYFIPASEALRKMSQSPANVSSHQPMPRPATPPLVKARPTQEPHYAAPVMPTMHHPSTPVHRQQPQRQVQHHMSTYPAQHELDGSVSDMIPHNLRQHTLSNPTATVDTASLLAFCDASLRKSNESEHRLEGQYKETIARLQSEIAARDQQIKQLAQQVEDLQLLTKILERKIRSA